MRKITQLSFFKASISLIKIKEGLDALLESKIAKISIRLSLGFLVLVSILILIFWTKLPPEIPLFYSRPWGKDQLVKKSWFLILSFICFFLMVFNLQLASLWLKKKALLAKILMWTGVILAFLTGTTIIRILLIVI